MVSRRALLLAPLIAPLAAPVAARAQGAIEITDIVGRRVRLPRPARRIVLGQGRHFFALSLLHPDPASLVVGWSSDFQGGFPQEFAQLRRQIPAVAEIPVIGRGSVESTSFERILGLAPDLVLLSRFNLGGAVSNGESAFSARLTSAGIASAVIDFFADPLKDAEPSIAVLGALLGLPDRAAAFNAFYRGKLDAVTARLPGAGERPSILVHAHAGGTPCCHSAGTGNFNGMILAAGGRNIAQGVLPGPFGQLSLEFVMEQDPRVYAATGGPFGGPRGGVTMGAGVTMAETRSSLAAMIRSQGLQRLSAIRGGRAHAIWHGFNDTPAHLLAIEALAAWLHPERMRGIDATATLAEMNTRFLAAPMEGTYWADLQDRA